MLTMLLAAATALPSLARSEFDLADLQPAPPPLALPSPETRSRYLPPEIDDPDDGSDEVRFRLRWRRVRVTMPLPSI